MTSTGPSRVEHELPTTPLAGADALLEGLLAGGTGVLRLWAPGFVALDRGEAPVLSIGATARTAELSRLMLERRALVVALDVERGGSRVLAATPREGASRRLPPPPGFEGGLGPAGTRGAQVVQLSMWPRQAPWAPGTYALFALVADRRSERVETVVGRAASTVDPAAESLPAASLRVWPPPDPAGNLPRYQPVELSPPVPAEPGIALVVPRVARGGTCPVHGAFRLRLRPRWIVQHGAVVPVTLVLTGSEDPTPVVLELRLPSFDRVDPANPPATVTGHFALDLLPLAPLATAPQTWFLHALSSDAAAPPAVIAVPTS